MHKRSYDILIVLVVTGLLSYAALYIIGSLEAQYPPPFRLKIFLYLFMKYDSTGVQITWVAIVIALLLLIWRGSWIDRILLSLSRHLFVVVGCAFVIFCLGTLFVYLNHPLSADESVPLYQAKIFAAGQLNTQIDPAWRHWLFTDIFRRNFFAVSIETGTVVSRYWPGWALLLTPFVKLGIPWMLNPLLGAGALVLLARLTRHLSDDPRAPGLVLLLTLASPAFTINAISYYSMTGHLFFNLLFALLLLEPSPRRLFLAGLVGSFALVLSNPIPHAIFAAPWFLWLLWRPQRWRNLGWLCLGYLPLSLLLGAGWAIFSKSIAVGKASLTGKVGPALPINPIVKLFHITSHMFARLFTLPSQEVLFYRLIGLCKLSLWAVPGLLAFAMLGAFRGRHNTLVRLMIASALSTLLFFLFVPFSQGHGWGFRYFHPVWWVLPLLAVPAILRDKGSHATPGYTLTFVVCLAAGSLFLNNGLYAAQTHHFVAEHLAQTPKIHPTRRQICFISKRGYYATDLIQNDPFLRNRVLFLVDHGHKRNLAFLRKYFPKARPYSWKTRWVWDVGGKESSEFRVPGSE